MFYLRYNVVSQSSVKVRNLGYEYSSVEKSLSVERDEVYRVETLGSLPIYLDASNIVVKPTSVCLEVNTNFKDGSLVFKVNDQSYTIDGNVYLNNFQFSAELYPIKGYTNSVLVIKSKIFCFLEISMDDIAVFGNHADSIRGVITGQSSIVDSSIRPARQCYLYGNKFMQNTLKSPEGTLFEGSIELYEDSNQ